MNPKLSDRPSTPCAAYVEAAPDITLIRDFLGGTRRVHARYKDYIAKYKAEKPDAYKRRATSAKVYGGLSRTLSAANGMLFAKPPTPSEGGWTEPLKQQAENIDVKGTQLFVYMKRRAEDAIADGFTVVLVDHPPAPDGVVVHEGNEEELNLRPFWTSYARADVLSWRTAIVNNAEQLVQVVLREAAYVNDGRFGVLPRVRYRVCSLVAAKTDVDEVAAASWELLEETKDATGGVTLRSVGTGIFADRAGKPFDEIPLAIVYAGRTDATLTAVPPLLDVAWANLEHWRVATNLRFYEDLICFPQPVVTGSLTPMGTNTDGSPIPGQFQVGPTVLVHLTTGSTYEMKELEGKSLDQLRASLQEKKDEISELGMSFLSKRSRGVETAEAKRLDATAENSTLATSAQGIEDGVNQALVYHARYLGIAKDQAPAVRINRDFDLVKMDPATMTAYVQAVASAGLPPRLLLQAWQEGGRIAADVDLDDLEAEMMANAAAAQAQKQAEIAAQQQDGPEKKAA